MAIERDPMQQLRHELYIQRNNKDLTDARIRALMMVAMIDGADKVEIEAMARAVGLHSEPKEETNE